MSLKIVVFLILALDTTFSTAQGSSNGEQLVNQLLKNSSNAVRPKLDTNEPVTITIGLQLIKIIGLGDSRQLLTGKYWTRYSWYNELMTWNASEWGNVREVNVRPNRIWTPDIVMYNDVTNNVGIDTHKSMVTMYANGKQVWLSPVTLSISCKVNSQYFPFDVQTCKLKFGSWTLNNKGIVLKGDNTDIVGDNYVPSSEWEMVDSKYKRNSVVYTHYGHVPYDDVTFTIKLSRKETGYLFFMIIPSLILVFTTLFSFCLPPDSGSRMVVTGTNLSGFAIFMLMADEILQRNSDAISIISVLHLVLVIESSFSVFMACCVLTVYHRGRQTAPPEIPKWLKRVLFNIYVKIFGVEASEFSSEEKKDKFKQPLALLLTLGPDFDAARNRKQFSSKAQSVGCSSLDVDLGPKLRHALSKDANGHSLPIDLQSMVTPQRGYSGAPAMTDTDNNIGDSSTLQAILKEIELIKKNAEKNRIRETLRVDWEMIGYMLDRLYFWIFVLTTLISSLCIFTTAYVVKYKLCLHHDHD